MSIAPPHVLEQQAPERAEQLLDRTIGLFRLLVNACEGSHRRACLMAAVESRQIARLRGVPTVELVGRLGTALGLGAGLAAEVVGAPTAPYIAPDDLRTRAAEADLDDDAPALEQLAHALHRAARHPAEIGLAHLLRARALAARGDIARACDAVRIALEIGIAPEDRAIAGQLAGTIHGEALLGAPWEPTGLHSPAAEHLARLSGAGDPMPLRTECWRLSHGAIAHPRQRAHHLAGLASMLDHAQAPAECAWCASIGAITALRVLESDGPHGPGSERCLRLIVACELALDEALARECEPVRRVLVVRRTRVALCEWATRAALGEVEATTVDAWDREEIQRSLMWFPSAALSPRIAALAGFTPTNDFQQIQNHMLDASSGDCWMVEKVQGPRASGATAGSRSEDPC